jgi:hypothetical protein
MGLYLLASSYIIYNKIKNEVIINSPEILIMNKIRNLMTLRKKQKLKNLNKLEY